MKAESASHGKKGKREYLNNSETNELLRELNRFFEVKVEVTRIRNGEHQTIETLIRASRAVSAMNLLKPDSSILDEYIPL
jgi:hypothetical protein